MMRVLLINLGDASLAAVKRALAGQGYEIASESGLTTEEVMAISPEVLVTEASPSDLSCCGLITQLKAQPYIGPSLKVVMIVHGSALERARALDLGADDVISFPLDEVEFAAKVRTQFRERRPEEELLKYAVQREHYAEIAVESLSGGTVSKRRFWLIPSFVGLSALTVIAAVFMIISTGSSRKATLQLRAEIARMNTGMPPQQQLEETQNRLAQLEKEGQIAETVVQKYGPSVCLLHIVVEFREKESGQPLQIAVDAAGKPLMDDKGMAQFHIGGRGPRLQVDAFGTGFLVRRDGVILTNHHVAEPWWHDEELKQLIDRGVDPYVLSYEAYFPGKPAALQARLDRISSKADLATLKLEAPAPNRAELLELDDRKDASITGEPVVLIGYPTGVEGILARAGPDVAQKIAGGRQNVSDVMSQIAAQRLIRPTTTQGHIGDVLQDQIVYDAATTSGGSGAPLLTEAERLSA